jgi:PAS domain S-box-containing protein
VEGLDIWFSVNTYCPALGEFIAIFDTITEQKRAEIALREVGQRLELATRSGGLGIWDWNLETGAMLWDSRMMEIYGYGPGDFPGGLEAWERRLHPEDKNAASADIQAALRGEREFHSEFRILLPDGGIRHVSADGLVQRNAEGRAIRMIGLNRDVTDQWRANDQRRRMEAELQQAQKLESLGSLASGVAHDMNNVLSAILSIASTMQVKYGADEFLLKAMRTLEQAALRGRDMVKRLTNFVRKDLETPHLIDLNALVAGETDILRQTLRHKVTLEVNLEPHPGWIMGETSTLGSALMNLCVNAIDAMPEGGTLYLETQRQGTQHIQLIVRDTGQGMSPETLVHATEAFYTTKPVGKGTGLGLAMVQNIVRAHGGELDIQSLPGNGTRVAMRFPLVQAEPEQAGEVFQAGHPLFRPLSILMVDDDALVRSTFPPLLRELGHQVEVVEDGPSALRLVEAGRAYDLVLVDHNMPGMTGAQVLDRIKEQNSKQAVLIITGFRDGELDQSLARWPSTAVLIKPITRQEVTRCLDTLTFKPM